MSKDYDVTALFGQLKAPESPRVAEKPSDGLYRYGEVAPQTKKMTWCLPVALLERMARESKRCGVKQYAIVERAIEEYLDRHEGE